MSRFLAVASLLVLLPLFYSQADEADSTKEIQPIATADVDSAILKVRRFTVEAERFLKDSTLRLDKKTVSELAAKGSYVFNGFLSHGEGHFDMKGHGDQDLTDFLQYSVTICSEDALRLRNEVDRYSAAFKKAIELGKKEANVIESGDYVKKSEFDRVQGLIKKLPEGVLPVVSYQASGLGMGLYDENGVPFNIATNEKGDPTFLAQTFKDGLDAACRPGSIRLAEFKKFLDLKSQRSKLLDQLMVSDLSSSQRTALTDVQKRAERTFLYVSQFEDGPLLPFVHYKVVDKAFIEERPQSDGYWRPTYKASFFVYGKNTAVCFYLNKTGAEKAKAIQELHDSDVGKLKQFYLSLD